MVQSPFPPGVTGGSHVVLGDGQIRGLVALRAAVPASVRIYVTSGTRTARAQASALKTKRELGDDLHALYRADDIVDAILAVPNTVDAMAAVIQRYADAGRYMSGHQRGNAVDIRIKDISRADLALLVDAATRLGFKPLVETKPPHLHIEMATLGERAANQALTILQSGAAQGKGKIGRAAGAAAAALYRRRVLLWSAGAVGTAALVLAFIAVRRRRLRR